MKNADQVWFSVRTDHIDQSYGTWFNQILSCLYSLGFTFSLKVHGDIMQTRFDLGSDRTRAVVLRAGEGQMYDWLVMAKFIIWHWSFPNAEDVRTYKAMWKIRHES